MNSMIIYAVFPFSTCRHAMDETVSRTAAQTQWNLNKPTQSKHLKSHTCISFQP